MTKQGTIRLYKQEENYGFIVNPEAKPGENNDFYFHRMDLRTRTEKWIPQEGEAVTYELVKTNRGWHAKNVSQPVTPNITPPTRPAANPTNPSPSQAHAPFNFVPLNETVVPGEDVEGKLTGFIELEITAETPLYVRNTLTVKKYGEKEALREENPKKPYLGNPDFFQPGGLFRLPGSSLRGMVRTLVEIIGHGSFNFFDGKARFYFRDIRKPFYRQVMTGGDRYQGYFSKARGGYLYREGLKYKIVPAKNYPGCNCNCFKVEETTLRNAGILIPTMGFLPVKFKPESAQRQNRHRVPLYYSLIREIYRAEENIGRNDLQPGNVICSGRINGKHMHWVIGAPSESPGIPVPDDVIQNYRNDKGRRIDESLELLRLLDRNPQAKIPCFFLTNGGEVSQFGHTGMFRLSYNTTVGDHVPSEITAKGLDLAQKIFGVLNSKPSRVFFEDAFLFVEKGNTVEQSPKRVPKILSTPKPTSYQLYLEQNNPNNPNNLTHYNDPIRPGCKRGRLRGYKLYWHQSAENWQEEGIIPDNLELSDSEDTQHTILCPMEAKSVFSGRIRFEGLTSVELGCLLFALDLPQGCHHKIGMGKPLGLGSIHVEPKLFLSDRKKRYATLEREWQSPPEQKESRDTYKSRFAQYLLKLAYSRESDSETSWEELWKTDRMKELKRLLAFNPGPSPDGRPRDSEIQYMDLDDFKSLSVLPKPTEVG